MDVYSGATAWLWTLMQTHAGNGEQVLNAGIGAALKRLENAVVAKISGDTALSTLRADADSGQENPRTLQRVRLALEEAAEIDPQFAETLRQIIDELDAKNPRPAGSVSAGRDLIQNTGPGSMIVHTGSGNLGGLNNRSV